MHGIVTSCACLANVQQPLSNFASDLGAACDSLAEEVFESEFVVQSAAPRKIYGQAA